MFPIETINAANQRVKTAYYGINDTDSPTLASYTLSVSSGSNGTINPVGNMSVASGSFQFFTLTPNTGYTPHLQVDGVEVVLDSNNSYRLSSITTNHTVTASFIPLVFNINVSTANNYGTISPSGNVSVPYGGSQTFTITPNSGFFVSQVLVDGVPISKPTNNSFTLSNITSGHTITVRFVILRLLFKKN